MVLLVIWYSTMFLFVCKADNNMVWPLPLTQDMVLYQDEPVQFKSITEVTIIILIINTIIIIRIVIVIIIVIMSMIESIAAAICLLFCRHPSGHRVAVNASRPGDRLKATKIPSLGGGTSRL